MESMDVPCTVTCARNYHGTMVSRPKPLLTGLIVGNLTPARGKYTIYHPSGQLGAFVVCGNSETPRNTHHPMCHS